MTATVDHPVEDGWSAVAAVPPVAAPLRAVDFVRFHTDGDRLSLTARVAVRGDDPNLLGHFPGLAVFPGIFIIEALAQAMALTAPPEAVRPPTLRCVRSVRFVAPLLDGDELTLNVTADARPEGGWDVTAKGLRADGSSAARIKAEFGAAVLPGSPDEVHVMPLPSPGPTGAAGLAARGQVREHVDIRAVLPQRYPLLLVDRVLRLQPGAAITTLKAVTGTEPCYAALPDGAESWRYGYPYSLMVESLGQTAALLWLDGRAPAADDGQVLMFVGAKDYHFEGYAYPGDVLRHEVQLESVIADTAFATGETWVGDRRIATVGTLIATRRPVRPSDAEPPASLAG